MVSSCSEPWRLRAPGHYSLSWEASSLLEISSDAAALRWPAAIVRDRRHVTDRRHLQAASLQRAQRRFTSRARPAHFHLDGLHAVLHGGFSRLLGGDLGGIGRRLARALEAELAGRGPGDRVALHVGDGDHRVVERCIHMDDARGDVLALLAARTDRLFRHIASLFLLAGDGLGRAFAGAGIGVGTLAADRQALAVAQAAISAEIHEPLNIHGNFAAKVALDDIVAVDDFADLQHFGIRQLVDALGCRDVDLLADNLGIDRPDAMDIAKGDFNALVGRNVNACDAGHFFFLLSLTRAYAHTLRQWSNAVPGA